MPTTYTLSDPDYARFRDLVRSKSGLDFSEPRRPDLERGVQTALDETNSPDAQSLYRLLSDDSSERWLNRLIARLTIGETYFFRNRPQFEALEQHILPDIIRRRSGSRRLRIWSAGCASGEEPYSLAILLRRLLPDIADWNISILATDINPNALDKAQRGDYGAWSFREIAADIQGAYFSPHGRELRLAPAIRDMVTFAYLNLAEDIYPSLVTNTSGIDLIVCRNVTIYFHEETTRQVARRFYESLSDDGWLVVGPAEPSQTTYHQFVARNFPGAVVYQKSRSERGALTERSAAPAHQFERPASGVQAPTSWQDVSYTRLPNTNTMLAGANIWPSASEPHPAAFDARTAAQAHHSDVDRLHSQVTALTQAGPLEQTLQLIEDRAANDSLDAETPYLVAKIAANQQHLALAERSIELALRRAPLMAPAHYLHALILQQRQQDNQALAALRRCVYADPHFVLGHVGLAGLYTRQGQPQRARKAMETIAQLLAGRAGDELIAGGEGLTVGRVLELVDTQR